MEKNTYYVITEEKDGKYLSYAETIRNNNNLVGMFGHKDCNVITVNACDSRNKAEQITIELNESWKKQGKYMFD